MKASQLNKKFYKGKKVFVTGHTGFKGSWLTVMLNEIGAISCGYSLAPEAGSLFEKIHGEKLICHIEGNLCNSESLKKALLGFQPEIILHLAAVSNIPEGLASPHKTYSSNVLGTVNLLEAVCECASVKSVLVVTSDKVYENKGDGAIYTETDRLGGVDPYSVSKIAQDLLTHSYKQTYLQNIGIATGRASNVLAGGDHNQTRLIPSVLNSFASGELPQLRNPAQQRPWQSVFDALNGYLTIARKCFEEPEKFSGAWNIGPTQDGIRAVADVVALMQSYYDAAVGYSQQEKSEMKESATLGLDISKSMKWLEWKPEQSFSEMFWDVVNFFKLQQKQVSEYEICRNQINDFFNKKGDEDERFKND